MANLAVMLAISSAAHEGQYDKMGQPYFLHPLRVMNNLETNDEELKIIALGHDLFEDTDVTPGQLEMEGFSDRVILGIEALTKRKEKSPEDYLAGILANRDAIRVKLADLEDNMNPRRMVGITEKDLARMQKYQIMYWTLKEKLKDTK
jgi:(p)ppGpp synthase/HD superfamily hydrolase